MSSQCSLTKSSILSSSKKQHNPLQLFGVVINQSPLCISLAEELNCKTECERVKEYIATEWPDGVVKYVRTKERSGLIRARTAGAKAATGDVLIFLDSHCEAAEGW